MNKSEAEITVKASKANLKLLECLSHENIAKIKEVRNSKIYNSQSLNVSRLQEENP